MRHFSLTLLAMLCLSMAPHAQTAGSACTGSATAGPDANGQNLKCNGSTWQVIASTGIGSSCQRVQGSTGSGTTTATSTASCAAGYYVIGGGFQCSGGFGLYSYPNSSTSWFAQCYNSGSAINVTAFAVCCP